MFYATAMTHGGEAIGVLVESHEGRPTKIEGNPGHPGSLGATDIFAQGSILSLYDPDRAQTVTHRGQTRTWDEASEVLRAAINKQRANGGSGLRLLTGAVLSPTLGDQLEGLLKEFPQAKRHVWEPVHNDAAYRAAQSAFGRPLEPLYDFTKADVVVSFDADFLFSGPGHVRYANDFIERRRAPTSEQDAATAAMNRLYVVELAISCTGAKADHRLALRDADIASLAARLGNKLDIFDAAQSAVDQEAWISAVADDLNSHRGRSLVVAGPRQPEAIHLLVMAINERLGNVGATVRYIEPVEWRSADRTASLRELTQDVDRGDVELLVMLDTNPVYTAPADFNFAERLKRVPLCVAMGLYEDETSQQCQWHLPQTHYLETWGDARAYDGAVAITQPLIEPLYQGRSAQELIAFLRSGEWTPARELVRMYWQKRWNESNTEQFETRWQTSLHDGVLANTSAASQDVRLAADWTQRVTASLPTIAGHSTSDDLQIIFHPDPSIYDGRYANNGWLQELPKPLTKLTWDNAAIMSPATASRFGLTLGSYAHGGEHGGYYMPTVNLRLDDRTVRAVVWIMPGHADGTVSLSLGYGRTHAGRIGGDARSSVGTNAYALRTADRPWGATGLELVVTGKTQLLACTQQHHNMENRDLVRTGTLDEFRTTPHFADTPDQRHEQAETERAHEPLTFYKAFDYDAPKHKWGMSIDLTACIGCNACVVACQAENNIPVVGKEQVAAGREMHWIRVDRYVHGPADDPDGFYFQPLPCQQCENAPCEYVCPVEATVHSADGLNDMIYNRCVGTRYCSNNCPYKVRRFNFLAFADFTKGVRSLQYNPDVTVRSRGVMEKCTYCVQRIRHAEIDSDVEQRPIADGEVLTACQAACPTRAIVFGNMNDEKSAIAKAKRSPLNYGLLTDLNTHPRTTYLAELRNPNPAIEA